MLSDVELVIESQNKNAQKVNQIVTNQNIKKSSKNSSIINTPFEISIL